MKKKILIVGAGPVGLSAAYFLSQIPQLSIQIVQKCPLNQHQVFSKALSINSRTMQLFNNTQIQEVFLNQSYKITKYKISTKQKNIIQSDLQKVLNKKTKYPAIYIYPQTMTERVLEKQLNKNKNIYIKREKQVINVKNSQNAKKSTVIVEIKDINTNKIQIKQYDYLLSTDGADSTIRKMFNLSFNGQTLTKSQIFLSDFELQPNHEPIYHTQTIINGQNLLIIIPITQKYIRIMANSKNYLNSLPQKYKINKRHWTSEFIINNRVIQKMNIGNVYFAGDSAHVHAPLGNRGMNLGIEDVYIFAKLLKAGKVEKYHQIRYQTVKKFVQKVNDLSKKTFSLEKTWSKRLLPFLGPVINHTLKNDILFFITGLDYQLPVITPKL